MISPLFVCLFFACEGWGQELYRWIFQITYSNLVFGGIKRKIFYLSKMSKVTAKISNDVLNCQSIDVIIITLNVHIIVFLIQK